MFERRIYSDPRAKGIEIHFEKISHPAQTQMFKVIENGTEIEEVEIPQGQDAATFIQAFLIGCKYMSGGMREARLMEQKNQALQPKK